MSELDAFAEEVRAVAVKIVAAADQGRLDQVKALGSQLCLMASIVEQAEVEGETDEQSFLQEPYHGPDVLFPADAGGFDYPVLGELSKASSVTTSGDPLLLTELFPASRILLVQERPCQTHP